MVSSKSKNRLGTCGLRSGLALVLGLGMTSMAFGGWGGDLGPGVTGYYVGLSTHITRHKVTPTLDKGSFKIFDGDHLHKEFKDNLFGATFTAGYLYALGPVALAGQAYFGMGGKKVSLHDTWDVERKGVPFTVRSDLDLWGRYQFGWELLAGVKLSSLLVYGLLGFQGRMMQTRGQMTLTPRSTGIASSPGSGGKAILFFGKDAATVEGIEFAKLQPAHKVVFSPTIGIGVRLYLMNLFFVGIEGRHAWRERTMKARYAFYNTFEGSELGSRSTSTQERKDRLEPRFKMSQWSANVIVGFRM